MGRHDASTTPMIIRSAQPLILRSTYPLASASAGAPALVASLSLIRNAVLLASTISVLVVWLVRVLNTPSRVYDRAANSVGREYDAWTSEGILEYYWGEHIHLGYYGDKERHGPFYGGKDFIQAKYDFIDKMLEFSQAQ